jgi:MFS transporter, Spinster family, sphingosine-1-phosphate transporter
MLVVLLAILIFSYADGQALGLVLQSIKVDLHLSDTQLGLLTGIAFAFFYSVMGIPIARWADRGNRVTIISLTAAVWSVLVSLTGRATNFVQLLLIRSGVAIGESGCVPAANSLISDYFAPAERPRAMGIFLLGGPSSLLVGYFAAGWLNQFFGWRVMFLLLGLPGLVLAAVARFTLREPRVKRRQNVVGPNTTAASDNTDTDADTPSRPEGAVSSPTQPSVKEVFSTLRGSATFRHLLICLSIAALFTNGMATWLPTFMIRSYDLKTGALGTGFTLALGASGFVGTYLGGALASRYAANNERLQLKALTILFCAFAVIWALVYLSRDYYAGLAWMALGTLGGSMAGAPVYGMIQTLVPSRMIAISIAIIYLFSNLIGAGLGPLAAGALSDLFQAIFGLESLRYALLVMCPGYIWAGLHLWLASKTVTKDLRTARAEALRSSSELVQVD